MREKETPTKHGAWIYRGAAKFLTAFENEAAPVEQLEADERSQQLTATNALNNQAEALCMGTDTTRASKNEIEALERLPTANTSKDVYKT